MSSFIANWSTQVRKGLLELAVLNALSQERLYGYELVKQLSRIRGLVIGEGTIYPIMSRLQREGLITGTLEQSPEGPARKYYALSDRGRAVLAEMKERWSTLVAGIGAQGGGQ